MKATNIGLPRTMEIPCTVTGSPMIKDKLLKNETLQVLVYLEKKKRTCTWDVNNAFINSLVHSSLITKEFLIYEETILF